MSTNAAWDLSAWEGVGPGGGTQPALSVAGRVDGEGYEVSAGARSLTISNPDGAALVTTVHGPTSGSITVTGATTTAPSWTAPADEALAVKVEATKDSLTSEVSFAEQTAYSGGAAGTLTAILDIDWVALHTASGAYNFLTDGPAGDGTHSYGGYTFELVGSTTVTQLEVTANGLEVAQNTGGAFQLGVNLRDLASPINPAGPIHVLSRMESATSGASGDGMQVGVQRDPTLGNWTTGDTVVRYRRADATPDLYAIIYNGSTFDVLASSAVTASGDVRMQVDLTSLLGAVTRGDTGTATDPADWQTLAQFSKAGYASALAAFSGTYPASSDAWAFVGCGNSGSGTVKTLTAYGLSA